MAVLRIYADDVRLTKTCYLGSFEGIWLIDIEAHPTIEHRAVQLDMRIAECVLALPYPDVSELITAIRALRNQEAKKVGNRLASRQNAWKSP